MKRGAFYNCSSLEDVQLPESLETIGAAVFLACYELKELTVPAAVTSIDHDVFTDCTSLTEIQVASGNTAYSSVEGVLFDKAKAKLIVCPAGKTGTYRIPDTVTYIDSAAFAAGNLSSISIPASVTTLGSGSFVSNKATQINVDSGNEKFISEDGVLFNKTKTVLYCWPAGKTGVYHVPDTVQAIEAYAFYRCKNLTGLYLDTGIKNIYYAAFYECESLSDVYYSGTEHYWNGISIEEGNESLTESQIHFTDIVSGPTSGTFTYENGYETDVSWAISGDTLTITASQEQRNDFCPGGYDNVTSSIEEDGTLKLSREIIHPWEAHKDSIKKVVIDSNIVSIWPYAFYGMEELESVTIQAQRLYIRYAAFACSGVRTLNFVSDVGFYNVAGMAFYQSHLFDTSDYYLANGYLIGYKVGITHFAPPEGTIKIAGDLCWGDTNLESVVLPEGFVQTSGSGWTFKDCTNLQTVILPDSCERTPDFGDCTALHTVLIPEGVISIAEQAFLNCTSLKRIVIPSSVTKIFNLAFSKAGGEDGISIYFKGEAPATFRSNACLGGTFELYYPEGDSTWETPKANINSEALTIPPSPGRRGTEAA